MNDYVRALTAQLRWRAAYRKVFNTPEGKIVLQHLTRKYVVADVPGDTADVKVFNLGKQRVVMEILSKVHSSDEALHKAIAEALEQPTKEQE